MIFNLYYLSLHYLHHYLIHRTHTASLKPTSGRSKKDTGGKFIQLTTCTYVVLGIVMMMMMNDNECISVLSRQTRRCT